MLKRLMATLLALLFATVAFAAPVDANKATQAELESVKGIGPAIATKILDERKKAQFKDWPDMIERVKGVGEGNAAKFSAAGLTVNGSGFGGAAPAAAKTTAKATEKAEAKADTKAEKAEKKAAKADKAAAAASTAKADSAKADAAAKTAKAEKAAAKKAADDKPAAKSADPKASDAKEGKTTKK